jgi:hypothetical protein
MSGSYFDPDWTAKVSVPVKRVGERWEFFYGGDIPVREGTLGELTLSANQVTDESFRRRITQSLTLKILDEGAELLVALSDRDAKGRAGAWPHPYPSPLDDLRTGVQAEGERKLLDELWAQVEQTLGWRPAPPLSGPKRKRT